jgi:UDP-N-acetylmuramyl pentapeptide phosphotransferase/UDP-N-acetylglucosamine-1-phosphate transferase
MSAQDLTPATALGCAVIAFGIAAALAQGLSVWLRRCGMVDAAAPGFQETSIPRGGGLAIVIPVLLGAAYLMPNDAGRRQAAVVLAASAGVALISLCDDIRPVAVPIRLSAQAAFAAIAIAALGPVRAIPVGSWGTLSLGAVAWPMSLLWIVGLTNAFNFMDGIDAMAGTTAAITGGAVALASWLVGQPYLGALGLLFMMASLGFLTANWPPARLFMGDVGSTFCGFLLATVPLLAAARGEVRILPIVGLAMAPFLCDTATTLVRRAVTGENVFQRHRTHCYQRLVLAGWTHATVSCLYAGLAVLGAGLGMLSIR